MKKILLILALFIFLGFKANAQPVTTNGGSGLAATYPSLAAAITALNGATITSPVIITLTGDETAPAGGYSITAEGTAANTIVVQGNSSTITTSSALTAGTLNDGIFKLTGADYVTIQNFIMQENPANTDNTPATNNMTEWGVALLYATQTNGSQNNTIQNNTINLNRIYGNTFGIYSNVRHSPSDVTTLADITNNTTAPNNSNRVHNNSVGNVNHGIVFIGSATAANISFNNDIGGISLATGNSISNYGGLPAGTAYVGYPTTIISGAFILNEANYNLSYTSIISAALNTATALRGILVSYDAIPVGIVANNVNNNVVTFTQAGLGGLQGITGAGLAGMTDVTLNMNENSFINNTVTSNITTFGIANLGGYGTLNMNENIIFGNTSTATTLGFIGMTNQGPVVNTINILNNEIGTEVMGAVTFSNPTTGGMTGISNTTGTATTTLNISGNTFRGFNLVSSGQLAFIINSGAPIGVALNFTNNQIGTSTSPAATYSAASAGNFFGIVNAAGAATATLNMTGNDIYGGPVQNVAGTGGLNYYNNQVFTGNTNISNNTLTNIVANSTGGTTMFSNNVTHAVGTTHNVNNNSVVGFFTRLTATGTLQFYNSFGVSGSTVTETNTGNNISNVTFTGTTTSFGWRCADGTTPGPRKIVTNNTFDNITGGTGAISSILYVGFSDNTFDGNNVSGNTISNVSSSGNIFCIISDGQNQNFFQNTISNISSNGAAAQVRGFNFTGATTQNVYRNRISNLNADGATATVHGIALSGGTTYNINNNFIGPLTAPSTSSATDAIRGISSTSATTLSNLNVIFNTIYINAVSTGTDFSTSGIFHTTSATSTTAQLNLINNIIINTSTPNGTGVTSAYRRSSATLDNYGATSDYNDFYAGTPSATNLIFYDGTTGDQTLADYKTRVAPRDANSVSTQVFFADAANGDLHLAGASIGDPALLGIDIPGITYDYDGNTRSNPPTIGADEPPQAVTTNGGSGLAVTYPSLAAAITALNAATINSPVVITVNVNQTASPGGYEITAEGSAVNTITIQGATILDGALVTITASNALTVGALNDGIFKLIGADYITIENLAMLENPANTITTAGTNDMTEWGVALLYATTTNGSNNNTIQDCYIDLNRAYQNTFGIYSNSTHSPTAVTVTASATGPDGGNNNLTILNNYVTDVNNGIVHVGPTAAADHNIGALISGNEIIDYGRTGTFSGYANVSGTLYGILVRNTKEFSVIDNNIESSNGGITAGTTRGIYIPAFSNAPTGTFTNNINNNNISIRPGASVTITGIHNENNTSTSTSSINVNNNNFHTFGHTVAATSAITFIQVAGSAAAGPLNFNINGNTFTDITVNTTGSVTFINNSISRPIGATSVANNNSIVTGFNKTGAGGTILFYESFGVSPSTVTETCIGNNFSNMTFTGATTITGFRVADGSGANASIITVTDNVFNNITGGTNATTIMTLGFSGITVPTMSTVSNNTISNITGGGNVTGVALASLAVNFSNNRIFNLQTNSTTTAIVSGVAVTSSLNTRIFNNFISNLKAPDGNSTADNIRGINITSTTANSNIDVIYNSIYLNEGSTGTNFSSAGVFHTTSATPTTATLNLINNIIINTSTANGTGVTSAYRRSSTALTNYGATSDYNNFYAGTPSATSLIFYDGTNSIQTIADYKTHVAPRDANSVSTPVFFVNAAAGDLHLTGASQGDFTLEGINIPSITDDIDGDTRHDPPYMGADESTPPLPVELTSFTATIDRRDVHLNWTTASEMNNAGFDIERKHESNEVWIKAGFAEGNGTTNETQNYSFTDRGLNTGKYNYRLKQIDYNGNFEYFNLSNEVIIGVPDKYDLSQNYPNPFNPTTKINFDLPFDSRVTMKIFDITGREIATLVNEVQSAGYYTVTFDARNIASGMYFYRIIAEGGSEQYVMTKKMMVIK